MDQGNTVLVIEHNLDVIKTADWIIDMGPEGGDKGGNIIACGPPEKIVSAPTSYTGAFLKKSFEIRKIVASAIAELQLFCKKSFCI